MSLIFRYVFVPSFTTDVYKTQTESQKCGAKTSNSHSQKIGTNRKIKRSMKRKQKSDKEIDRYYEKERK